MNAKVRVWCVFMLTINDPTEPQYSDLVKIFLHKKDAENYIKGEIKEDSIFGDHYEIEQWEIN